MYLDLDEMLKEIAIIPVGKCQNWPSIQLVLVDQISVG